MIPACLCFSKNRPAQLHLLLQSAERFAPWLPITVLAKITSEHYQDGYTEVERLHPAATLAAEHNFEEQLRRFIEQANRPVMFLVDDDVFYAPAIEPTGTPWSYRPGEYWYPFTLDGGVYDPGLVLELLASHHFHNPTTLEAAGRRRVDQLGWTDFPIEYRWPCLVGIPANVVSESSSETPHMNIDPGELNERFLGGEELDLGKLLRALRRRGMPKPHMQIGYSYRQRQPLATA